VSVVDWVPTYNTYTTINTLKQKIIKGLLFDTEPNEPYGDWGVSKVMIVNNSLPKMYMFGYDLMPSYDNDSCLRTFTSDDCYTNPTYYLGLGGPYYPYCEWGHDEYAYELVYYKKGDTEWGTPFDFEVSVKDYEKDNSFNIYPNPANDYITIKSANNEILSNCMIDFYDIFGRKCLSKHIENSEHIDISFLQKGYYTVKLIQENKKTNYIKIIKQ
jgi:hypothetical protein